jgi:protein-S-isoprenylcysteine O-methyltransferase Ste14
MAMQPAEKMHGLPLGAVLPQAARLRARARRGLGLQLAHQWRRFNYWRRVDPHVAGEPVRLTRKAVVFDLAERLIITTVFGSFLYRMWLHSDAFNVLSALLCVAEALPFIYVVLRAPSASLSQRPLDWGVGILGSVTPLLISPEAAAPLVPLAVCFALMVAGMMIQISAKVVLGRAFGIIAANRGVRVLGPYRFVRHPMYAGYTMTHIGFLLSMPLPINALYYGTALALQIVRIYREEKILMQDPSYRAFAARVRYRLLPGIF